MNVSSGGGRDAAAFTHSTRPRLGFVGLGWIGASRLSSLRGGGHAEVAALCEPDPERLGRIRSDHPEAPGFTRLDDLLERASELALDGVIVATPNALHTRQCIEALDAGLPVLCQKPLTITRADAERVIAEARARDLLLSVDYTYRCTESAERLRELVLSNELGEIFAIDACFHNAYGPDKKWCFDLGLSGGGALLDLGVHLLDLISWSRAAEDFSLRDCVFRRGGARLARPLSDPEDFAELVLEGEPGSKARVSVSWNAHIGSDCRFRLAALGSRGSALFQNVGGSFYEFELCLLQGRSRTQLVREGASSLARGTVAWCERLARSPRFDPEIESTLHVAEIVDRAYGR